MTSSTNLKTHINKLKTNMIGSEHGYSGIISDKIINDLNAINDWSKINLSVTHETLYDDFNRILEKTIKDQITLWHHIKHKNIASSELNSKLIQSEKELRHMERRRNTLRNEVHRLKINVERLQEKNQLLTKKFNKQDVDMEYAIERVRKSYSLKMERLLAEKDEKINELQHKIESIDTTKKRALSETSSSSDLDSVHKRLKKLIEIDEPDPEPTNTTDSSTETSNDFVIIDDNDTEEETTETNTVCKTEYVDVKDESPTVEEETTADCSDKVVISSDGTDVGNVLKKHGINIHIHLK